MTKKTQAKGKTTKYTKAKPQDYEYIDGYEIDLGKKGFIQVAKKQVKSETGKTIFVSIAKGFTTTSGDTRFKSSVAIPTTAISELIEALTLLKPKGKGKRK